MLHIIKGSSNRPFMREKMKIFDVLSEIEIEKILASLKTANWEDGKKARRNTKKKIKFRHAKKNLVNSAFSSKNAK